MQRLELTLDGDARCVPSARHFVEEALRGWDLDGVGWTAALVVTELAANAALHAGTPFTVVVALEGDRVRVQVRDGSARMPRARSHSLESTTGRGLRLVEDLSVAWGIDRDGAGKAVWALLPTAVSASADDDDDVEALLAAFTDELDEPDIAGTTVLGLAA